MDPKVCKFHCHCIGLPNLIEYLFSYSIISRLTRMSLFLLVHLYRNNIDCNKKMHKMHIH